MKRLYKNDLCYHALVALAVPGLRSAQQNFFHHLNSQACIAVRAKRLKRRVIAHPIIHELSDSESESEQLRKVHRTIAEMFISLYVLSFTSFSKSSIMTRILLSVNEVDMLVSWFVDPPAMLHGP